MKKFQEQRQKLVEQHIAPIIDHQSIVAAFRRVPRHLFVPKSQRLFAYQDQALPIGKGQTISQPSLVAQMTELLSPSPGDQLLEIGTGSGYQTAILAELAGEVYTIERQKELSRQAEKIINQLGYSNIHFKVGDGTRGWSEKAPFDGIMVTAASPRIPDPLIKQLREGGRIVIPIGHSKLNQEIQIGTKRQGKLQLQTGPLVRFVPLIGQHGF